MNSSFSAISPLLFLISTLSRIYIGACYALLKYLTSSSSESVAVRRRNPRRPKKDGDVDTELPLILEQEYGDFKGVCNSADPDASKYLDDIPKHYFQFKENLISFLLDVASKHVNKYKSLVSPASQTGEY
jgi:hypothetical protein